MLIVYVVCVKQNFDNSVSYERNFILPFVKSGAVPPVVPSYFLYA